MADRVEPDRYEKLHIKLVGLKENFTMAERARIPDLWRKFMPRFGTIPSQVGRKVYGVSMHADAPGCFGYMPAVEVASFDEVPPDLTAITLDAPRYAVFAYRGGIPGMTALVDRIGAGWQAELMGPYRAHLIERYAEDFDPATASGGIDLLVPVAAE